MNKIKLTKRSAVAILLVLAIILIGIVSLRTVAEANDDVLLASSVYSERCEKIHCVADALRSLGFQNGSDIQKAALAYTGANNVLPLGTKVYIEGIGYRTVEDRGASWHQRNWFDEYLHDPAACDVFGVQWHDVYLVK